VDADAGLFPGDLLQESSTAQAPPFFSVIDRDFHLASNASAWEGGASNFSIVRDLDGLPRAVGLPDKGCFERQQ
jgi:hypothetical protein